MSSSQLQNCNQTSGNRQMVIYISAGSPQIYHSGLNPAISVGTVFDSNKHLARVDSTQKAAHTGSN
jgi:hypothetical protein